MTTALASIETDRLAKLVRLIFGSNKDGEVVAAVAAAKRLLASGNVDAHWLADRLTAPIALPACERDDRSAAWFAFHRRHFLSPKERAFIQNIVERSASLSPKQKQWLNDIVDRLEAA
jgi:DNA-binding transcriptional LysR family regulator